MRVIACLALVLLLLMPTTVQGATLREDRQSYVGSFTAIATASCGHPEENVGLACFPLEGNERAVSVQVRDLSTLTVPFVVWSEGSDSPNSVLVCADHVEGVAIPAGATAVSVLMLGAPWAQLLCPIAGVGSGVAGTVTAQFA